jgi:hypothetical protein
VTGRGQRQKERFVRQPLWKAILSDAHFWVPVVVLAIGIAILVAVR